LPPWIDSWTKPAVGSFYLRQPAIADMMVEAIQYNANILGHYLLHALPKLTKSLKGITARRANAMLGLTRNPFWQEESYDHLVRH
jgi:hypothetical protein